MKKPIHKYNGGLGATLCHNCKVIITTGLTSDIYCKDCADNKVTYLNRYRDKIIFEHIGDEVIMTGGSWFRYGYPNVYDDAYNRYVKSALTDSKLQVEQILSRKEFKEALYSDKEDNYMWSDNALYRLFGKYIYSDMSAFEFVDPSGGPYISAGDNLKGFWPKGKYQDLIVESIKMDGDIVKFKIRNNGTRI